MSPLVTLPCARTGDGSLRNEPPMTKPPTTQTTAISSNRRNPSTVVRILVVDDFEPFRRFVCTTVEARPELQVIGESADGLEAVQKAEELQPDLIFLDIGLPTLNGIEVAHRIGQLVPAAKILFISQDNDPDVVATALSNGAKGFVHKQNAITELLPAVEAILRGDRWSANGLISQS